jgi:hypothetical protein
MNRNGFSVGHQMNESVFRRVSAVLIGLMTACGIVTLGNFINRILPDWQPWITGMVCFFVALDSLYTRHRLKKQPIISTTWLGTAAAQVIVLFLIVKLVMSLSHGFESFLHEIPDWGRDFVENFITFDLLIAMVLVVIAWFLSGYFGELIDAMGMEQAMVDQSIEVPDKRTQPRARERLLSFVFSVLIILVMLTALTRVDLRNLSLSNGLRFYQMPPLAGGGASTLAYFMLGLALLSQTQFIYLHTAWGLARIPVSEKLAQRWALYSVFFLIFLAGITALLPTNYSLGFLSSLGSVLDLVVQAVFFVLEAVMAVLTLLINLPFLMMGKEAPVSTGDFPPPEIQPPPVEDAIVQTSVPWLDMLKSIFFWIFFLGVMYFAFSQYLRQHEEILSGLRKIPGWKILARFWSWLGKTIVGLKKGAVHVVDVGRNRLRALGEARRLVSRGGYINLRRLNPRQKIYFYYLAFIRRGREQGFPRQPAQTPSEYAHTLDNALPVAEVDIDDLTEAFVEARYSRHAMGKEKADQVKMMWGRIKEALRGKKQPHSG